MPKLNYPIKHTVNLFGGNSFQDLVIPKPEITIFTDASETGWGITDGHNPSGGQLTEPEMIHVNVQKLFLYVQKGCFYRNSHVRP